MNSTLAMFPIGSTVTNYMFGKLIVKKYVGDDYICIATDGSWKGREIERFFKQSELTLVEDKKVSCMMYQPLNERIENLRSFVNVLLEQLDKEARFTPFYGLLLSYNDIVFDLYLSVKYNKWL